MSLEKRLVREKTQGPAFHLIDTHAHLDMAEFDVDRDLAVARAVEAGVSTIINVGTDLMASRKAIRLAEVHPQIFATVGVHPHEAIRIKDTDMTELAGLTRHPRVVAIGEIGLDYHRNYSPRDAQLKAVEWQLRLASESDLPVIIHCRQAEEDMLPLLRSWVSNKTSTFPPGVIHCFNSSSETAQEYLDMGFYISIGAYLGYPSSTPLQSVVKSIPNDRLVIETDSPFLPPQAHRGARNEPAYLPLTLLALARIKRVKPEIAASEIYENAGRLFRLT